MPLGIFDKLIHAEKTFTPATAAYTAGDSIGGELSIPVTGSSSGCGLLVSAMVADNEGIGAAGALWIFKAALATPIADNDAFGVAFADYANLLAVITLDSYTTTSTFKHTLTGIDEPPMIDFPLGLLKVYFVPSGSPDWGSNKSVYIRLDILSQ